MPIIPKEIQDKIDMYKPWQTGAGVFKEGTPNHIILIHDEVLKWFKEVTDGEQ